MQNSAIRWIGRSLIVAAAGMSAACTDGGPVAPATTRNAQGVTAVSNVTDGNRFPVLPAGCEKLAAAEGSTLLLRALGVGVQIYRWNGTSWVFVNPSAKLYADAGAHGQVATHFGGPTWLSNSGSSVVGTVIERCTPDAGSIAWLSLSGVHEGPGIFSKVNFIQRLNTVGGNAPSTPGGFVGDEAQVPYTANYLFYKTP